MNEVITNPIFGIMVSVLVYLMGTLTFRRFLHPITIPLLSATLFIIVFLKISNISYADYYAGGSCLNTLVVPSTVALGIPFYCSFHLTKHHIRSILSGTLIVCIVNITFTVLIAKTSGIKYLLTTSSLPKSITTATVAGIIDKMGGITTATLVVVVIIGTLTSVFGPVLLKLLKIDNPVATGLNLGGTGHTIGTGTVLKYGHVEGVMAGLAIGVIGIVYVIISPIVAQITLK